MYVITAEGLVVAPYVARSSDAALSPIAAETASRYRFRPAQIDGKPESTVAESRVTFSCPP